MSICIYSAHLGVSSSEVNVAAAKMNRLDFRGQRLMLIKRSSLELFGYFMFLFPLNRKNLMNINACTLLWGLEYNKQH